MNDLVSVTRTNETQSQKQGGSPPFVNIPEEMDKHESERTKGRPPQFNQRLARCRHCGCKCTASRSSSVAPSANSALCSKHEWEILDWAQSVNSHEDCHDDNDINDDEDYDDEDYDGSSSLASSIHSGWSSAVLIFPPDMEDDEDDENESLDSMRVQFTTSGSTSSLGEEAILHHSMADSQSSLPRIGSNELLSGVSGRFDE